MPSLEETSLRLWNILNFKRRESEETEQNTFALKPWKVEFKKMIKLKYFVSMLLSLFSVFDVANGNSKIRSLKCLLYSYHECIDNNDLGIGKQIREYKEKICLFLETYNFRSDEHDTYETLNIEFFILDMQSSLLSNNILMAKFYENKANIVENCSTMKTDNVFDICRILYNDGLKLYKENKYCDSHYFLQKCYLILEKMDILNGIYAENKLRASTVIMLAKCCMKLNNKHAHEEASKWLKLLQKNESEQIESFKLQLELLDHQNLENKKAEDLIMKAANAFSSDAEILKQVMLVLNAYSHKHPIIAKNCLLYVFTNKVDFQNEDCREIIESYLISLIWMITSQLKTKGALDRLGMAKNILETGDKKVVFRLSVDSSNCLIIMLWSIGKKKMKEKNFQEALEWFKCCFVRLLNKSNESQQDNIGKIQRSMLQCCLKLQDLSTFEEILNSMKESDKENSITLYYRFVSILRSHNPNTNCSQIHQILTRLSELNDSRNIKLLALCVVESKNHLDSNKDNTAKEILNEPLKKAIDKLLNKCYMIGTDGRDSLLVDALRSSVYIQGKSLENELKNSENKKILLENVEIIERSVSYFLRFVKENKKIICDPPVINDIEWFSSNCFNYGLWLLEKNILDIKGVKLFQSVIVLLDYIDQFSEENRNSFFKWRCKAIIFRSFCEREIMYGSMNDYEKWAEIIKINKTIVDQISAQHTEKEYRDIRLQSILLVNEGLIVCRKWPELIKKVKAMNTYGKNHGDRNQELDVIVEKLFDTNVADDALSEEVMKVIDVILVERGFKREYKVGARVLFKWLYLLLTKMLDKTGYEDRLIAYVRMFKEFMVTTENDGTQRPKDFEIEWLAGVCWNKGIKIILHNQNNVIDPATADDDVSMDDSLLATEEEETHAGKGGASPTVAAFANRSPCRQGLPWCEEAIAISGMSSAKVQFTGMQRLYGLLVQESAVSGGFSCSGNGSHSDV